MIDLTDALGTVHQTVTTPARIACLVPSITELLYALELADQVVARTHFCIHPAEQLAAVASVGGTKKINHRKLRQLKPSHVIVNIDENTREMATQLAEYVPHVIVTHPLGPLDNLPLYRLLGAIFERPLQAQRLCQQFTDALDNLKKAANSWPECRVLYLIWRDPWMTVAEDTYISRTLALLNWHTMPQNDSSARYPTIEISTALLTELDLVLFSSEPYRFNETDLRQFAADYAVAPQKLALIDGEMTSWYGSRAIAGLRYLLEFGKKKALFFNKAHR